MSRGGGGRAGYTSMASPPATGRVGEWVQRKASHAADPVFESIRQDGIRTRPQRGRLSPATITRNDGGPPTYEARFGGTLIARTQQAQLANRRVYFPLADVVIKHLKPSAKRWR